jgi:hypothetical protein
MVGPLSACGAASTGPAITQHNAKLSFIIA